MIKLIKYCLVLVPILSGCMKQPPPPPAPAPLPVVREVRKEGTQPYLWQEPIVDVVKVPAGLDPEGNYYRPAHEAVVEIRQGRWQKKQK